MMRVRRFAARAIIDAMPRGATRSRRVWHPRVTEVRSGNVIVVAITLVCSLACEELGGFNEYKLRGNAGAPSVGAGQHGYAQSPGIHEPEMARVQTSDGLWFWIDSTEVTVGQYAKFLRAVTQDRDQDLVCAWNESRPDDSAVGDAVGGSDAIGARGFWPPPECMGDVPRGIDLAGEEPEASTRPMTCVDWCDAAAYCKWAGKELCRDDGNPDASLTTSEWVAACVGSDGNNLFGTAKNWGEGVCNDGEYARALQPVRASPDCFVQSNDSIPVFDLSGNAAEWVAWCPLDTQLGQCVSRGGSYDSASDEGMKCASVGSKLSRTATLPTLGFRCCAHSPEVWTNESASTSGATGTQCALCVVR